MNVSVNKMIIFLIILFFIGLAVFLTWYFLKHDRGQKKAIGTLWAAAGFGLLGTVIAAVLETLIIPEGLTKGIQVLGPSLILIALGIGVIEELSKFIPLAIFLYPKRYFNEHTDGVIYFALAGMGFGVPENILYTIQFGVKAGFARIILTPFFHAATTALVGYYLAKIKLAGQSKLKIIPPLMAAIVLHGLYDLGLLSGNGLLVMLSLMITAGLTVGLFLFFMRASELDQDQGLSAVGHNSFCRSCGITNPKHNLYCISCGKRA